MSPPETPGPCTCRWCQFSLCLATSLIVSGALVMGAEYLRPECDCECTNGRPSVESLPPVEVLPPG